MTKAELRTYAARKTNCLDSTGTFIDAYISVTAVDAYINIRRKELFWEFAEKYPESHEVIAKADLVANQQKYSFGGSMVDMYVIRYVGLKYDSSAVNYNRALRGEHNLLFPFTTDNTVFSQAAPRYILTSQKDAISGVLSNSIDIFPVPTVNVTQGMYIRYVEQPINMTDDAQVPYDIPDVAHHLIAYAVIADIWEQKGDLTKSDKAMNRYLFHKGKFFETYQPKIGDEIAAMIPSRVFNPFRRP